MNAHSRWNQIDLDAYRKMADPEADTLVAALLTKQGSESIGRLGYNSMLLIANKLIADPELALANHSRLAEWLAEMPEDLVGYFDPMEVPDWVDADKIQMGSQLWQEYTLVILLILYAGSLPACYLMKNGIPALYKTEKLREHQYIFQRIYETGTMLDACMEAGGIKVIKDAVIPYEALLLQVLHKLDPDGGWHQVGHHLVRKVGEPQSPLDRERLEQELAALRGKPKRYLWGKGYITAKKVRFLHASMRYMLNQPDQFNPWGDQDKPQSFAERLSHVQTPWDTDQFGAPVNQEDMAYTLLTFGLVIPQGLEKWGVPLTRKEKESFLHLWKVVGYVMGIHPELLTDDWDEAVSLYEAIQARQAGASEDGKVLTEALMGFLGDYLPNIPGLAHRLSASLIISQIGPTHAAYLLDEQLVAETQVFWRRLISKLFGTIFSFCMWLQTHFYRRFKHLGWITAYRLHEASELLIASWRDAYLRKPFFVPATTTSWRPMPGIDEAFLAELRQWRQEMFMVMGLALGLLAFATFGLFGSLPIGLLWGWLAAKNTLIAAATTWFASMGIMNFWLPTVFNKRPKPAIKQ